MKSNSFRMRPAYAVIPSFLIMLAVGGNALSGTYSLNAKAKNRVEFHSKATLESFSGKAKDIECELQIDPAQLGQSRGTVTVDLRSLDTGIELRNKHMRENHLHTDTFPAAVFQLDSVSGAPAAASGVEHPVTVHGRMTIHGKSKNISAPARLSMPSAETYRLQADFPLKITDYGIPRPEFLFLKLAEDVRIVVDLTVSPAAP